MRTLLLSILLTATACDPRIVYVAVEDGNTHQEDGGKACDSPDMTPSPSTADLGPHACFQPGDLCEQDTQCCTKHCSAIAQDSSVDPPKIRSVGPARCCGLVGMACGWPETGNCCPDSACTRIDGVTDGFQCCVYAVAQCPNNRMLVVETVDCGKGAVMVGACRFP